MSIDLVNNQYTTKQYYEAFKYCRDWNWHRLTKGNCVPKDLSKPVFHFQKVSTPKAADSQNHHPQGFENMFSRGQAKFTNSSHSQVHFSSLLKALRYRNWLTEGQHTNRWLSHGHTFFVQKIHQSNSTDLSLSKIPVYLMELYKINVISNWPCSLA